MSTVDVLLAVWLVVGVAVCMVVTMNLLRWGRPFAVVASLGPTGAATRSAAHGLGLLRLALLRAAFSFGSLLALAVVAALGGAAPLTPLAGGALTLAAGVAATSWAEQRWAHDPRRGTRAALLIGTAAGALAVVNGAALARGLGPDGWLPLLQAHLERRDRALEALGRLLLAVVPAWGLPCALVTDLRLREGARLRQALVVGTVVSGVTAVAIGLLELAYRLAATAERRLEAPP